MVGTKKKITTKKKLQVNTNMLKFFMLIFWKFRWNGIIGNRIMKKKYLNKHIIIKVIESVNIHNDTYKNIYKLWPVLGVSSTGYSWNG